MKILKTLILTGITTTLISVAAQAQSFGVTLGNGAGFGYSHKGGSVRMHSCGDGRRYEQGYCNPRGPIYYSEPPVVYYRQPEVVYPRQGIIVRTIPYTYNTSYQISYPARW